MKEMTDCEIAVKLAQQAAYQDVRLWLEKHMISNVAVEACGFVADLADYLDSKIEA